MSIEISNVSKRFGNFVALDHVSLEIPTGQLVALLGPSGCGKTTLLRIISGLEVPDEGSIAFHGEEATRRDVREREVGFVFQHYALFRHMTVFDNVAFGLRVRPRRTRPSEAEIRQRVMDLLKLVQLDWLAQRYPAQLSGGQRQRIALARALAVEPKVLLLDEPFGALDAKVRKDLRRWLRRLHDELHITSVFVTHDQEEALEVADRVVVLNKGRIEQMGTPDEVYANPASPFVYQFLGSVNLFHSRGDGSFALLGSDLSIASPEHGHEAGAAVAYVRPHDIDLVTSPGDAQGGVPAIVRHVRAVGPVVRLELDQVGSGERVEVEVAAERWRERRLEEGATVWVRPRQAKIFTASGATHRVSS